MGDTKSHRNVMRIAAVFSRHDDAFDWAQEIMTEQWGPIDRASERFDFTETTFYDASMGEGLRKQLFAFEPLFDPSKLAEAKLNSNQWEEDYRSTRSFHESRPINIDPGYVTEAKLVLATTKDRDHRIFLSSGIYAEVTLYYHRQEWRSRPWTYPDYLRPEVLGFLSDCRYDLRSQYNRA